MNDVGGDSKFSIKTGGVTASGVLPIARSHTISAGIHAAFPIDPQIFLEFHS